MKLTCVTAVFNAIASGNRENLIRCVASVAALKTEHEHLVYDGASTDGTVELLRELEAKTPGLKVASEKDTGIYNALNKGVQDAQGEWFYVLGCDDFICRPEVMDRLLSHAGASEMLVSVVFQDDGEAGHERPIKLRRIFRATPYCHQGLVMRTSLIRTNGGFDERYAIAADYDLLLKVHLKAPRIRYMRRRRDSFAQFGGAGLSSLHRQELDREIDLISAERLGLEPEMLNRYECRDILPIRAVRRYFLHPDSAIRLGAWHAAFGYRLFLLARLLLFPIVYLTRPLRYGHF